MSGSTIRFEASLRVDVDVSDYLMWWLKDRETLLRNLARSESFSVETVRQHELAEMISEAIIALVYEEVEEDLIGWRG